MCGVRSAKCNIKMSTKVRKESKLSKCMKAPLRVLSRVRDFYMRSVTDCAGKVSYGPYGSVMGGPAPLHSTLPRRFSVSSLESNFENDLRELIRAASTRSLREKIQLEQLRQQQAKSPIVQVNAMPRSQSVSIGRIDEDKPCEFGEDIELKIDLYPRSRSYAVGKRMAY